jgi:hypothetical protein
MRSIAVSLGCARWDVNGVRDHVRRGGVFGDAIGASLRII